MVSNLNIVFVCTHGSAKSLMAAEYFKRLAAQRGLAVEVTSAGTDPDAEVPANVITGLREDGIDVRGYRPRRVTQEELAAALQVIAFGCDLATLAPHGCPIERWDDVPPVSESFPIARDHILTHLAVLLEDCSRPPRSYEPRQQTMPEEASPSRRHLLGVSLCLLGAGVVAAGVGSAPTRLRLTEAAEPALRVEAPSTRFDFEQGTLAEWKTVDGRWAIEEMAEGPSGKRVLVQRATTNAFNVIVAPGGPYTEVDISVRFKPISGREDASGGIVFRFAERRYYVVRANALEDNFSFYYYDRGRREIASLRVQPPALGRWHTMRVVALDDHIQAYLNGTLLLDHLDSRFRAGQVGLWTKADSITAFDDLEVRGVRAGG